MKGPELQKKGDMILDMNYLHSMLWKHGWYAIPLYLTCDSWDAYLAMEKRLNCMVVDPKLCSLWYTFRPKLKACHKAS